MAEINYVEFHNFEVDCSEISGDITDISVIMQNSDVSLRDLCEAEFGCHLNTEERDELIAYLNELAGNDLAGFDVERMKGWLDYECDDFQTLLELLTLVTANLFRVATSDD